MITTYLRVTNDTSLLYDMIGDMAVIDHLERLALDWQHLPHPQPEGLVGRREEEERGGEGQGHADISSSSSSLLSDYGGDPNTFLECLSSYVNVVPALQAGNAEMMMELGR